MSAALPYLSKLRKTDLVDFAQITGLSGYEDYNKPDLVFALDNHLVANRPVFINNDRLADYYRRLTQPGRFATPAKRAMRVEVPSSSPVEVLTRSSRRQRPVPPRPVVKMEEKDDSEAGQGEETKSRQSVSATDESDAAPVPDNNPVQQLQPETPKAPATVTTTNVELPPSPAVVTDAIDRQTAAWGKSINDTWTASGVKELSHALRSLLSSVKAVETLVLLLEGSGIIRQIWPLRYLTTVPAIGAINTPEFAVRVPDFFILVDGSFWAPFSLWLLTSIFLPLSAAYFFNFSLQATPQQQSGNRNRAQKTTFDPLSFNIARALIAYLVYGKHFSFWDLYSAFSIDKVNASVPGQWTGMLTGTAIGLIGTLYEAALQR